MSDGCCCSECVGFRINFGVSNMAANREVEIEVVVKHSTTKALLVCHDGKTETWVPKSVINDYCGSEDLDTNVTSIFLSEEMAISKGLV